MTDPVYALIFALLAGGLLTAMVMPAPAHAVRDDAGAHLPLLAAGCFATIVMGILALLGRPAESTVCGAIAWLLVMPCVWLARAPRPADGWGDEEEDDDGGSPAPGPPSAPPAPDDGLPGLPPAAWPAARATWSAPPPAMPVTATAATVQRMLAAQAAQTLRAAAAQPARPQARRAADVVPLPQPAVPVPVPAPAPATQQRRLPATPRARADHRSIVHVHAADAHAGRRRASIGRRVLRRCRLWLWPATPDCVDSSPDTGPAHEGRQHGAHRDARLGVSESSSALRD